MLDVAIGHALAAEVSETCDGGSFWGDEIIGGFSVWIHVGVNASWSIAEDINLVF